MTCTATESVAHARAITPADGVVPPSTRFAQSSSRWAPPRAAAAADSIVSTHASIRMVPDMPGTIARWRPWRQVVPLRMGFTLSVDRVRAGLHDLRLRVRWPSRTTGLRLLLWVVIAAAVVAYLWVLWTETLHRR